MRAWFLVCPLSLLSLPLAAVQAAVHEATPWEQMVVMACCQAVTCQLEVTNPGAPQSGSDACCSACHAHALATLAQLPKAESFCRDPHRWTTLSARARSVS
jgi:hypothetical protein